MMRRSRVVGALGALLAWVGLGGAAGAVPAAMTYHGYVTYEGSAAPYEGTIAALDVTLEDASQQALWTHTYVDVEVAGGHFALLIGGGGSPPLDAATLPLSGLSLALTFDGVPMLPPMAVVSVPFALIAGEAEALGGTPAGEFVTFDDLEGLGVLLGSTAAPVATSNAYSDLDGLPDLSAYLRADGATPLAGDLDAAGHRIGRLAIDAGASAPPSSSAGQLWWDAGEATLRVFDGATWTPATPPAAPLIGGQCAEGEVAVGTAGDGGPLCAAPPPAAPGSVGEEAIQAGAITADKLGIACAPGELLVRSDLGWICGAPATLEPVPGPNLLLNPSWRLTSAVVPVAVTLDVSEGNRKVQPISGAELTALLGSTATPPEDTMATLDLRSTSDGTGERAGLYASTDPRTEVGVTVTCSVWARHADSIGTLGKARMSCFGQSVEVPLPLGDASWHRLEVTTQIPDTAPTDAAMWLYGSGPAVGADAAFVRYALPKLEYGAQATAWNAGTGGGAGTLGASREQLPWRNPAFVQISDTSVDLGLQLAQLVERYGAVRVELQHEGACCTTYTWNHPVSLAAFQYLQVYGEGFTNGANNIKVTILMNDNPTFTSPNVSGEQRAPRRLHVTSHGYFSLRGVNVHEVQNDLRPLASPPDRRGLFNVGGTFATLDLTQIRIQSTETVANISGHAYGRVQFGHTHIHVHANSTRDVTPVTASHGWNFAGHGGLVARSHTTTGAGVVWSDSDRITYFQ